MSNYEDSGNSSDGLVARGVDASDVGTVKQEQRALKARGAPRAKRMTRPERTRKLHEVVSNLLQELQAAGFIAVAARPRRVTPIGPEVEATSNDCRFRTISFSVRPSITSPIRFIAG